jgi:hypothetical protein
MCRCGHHGTSFTSRELSGNAADFGGSLSATGVRVSGGRMGFAPPAYAGCSAKCPRCGNYCALSSGSQHQNGYHDCGSHAWK